MNPKKVILIIMDGWGEGQVPASDAIQNANVPFVRSLYSKYPHTTLVTYGESVGLPEGQMGNSEVGHLNIGAGRVVYQELQRINVAVRSGELEASPVLQDTIEYALKNNKTLHLMGLVSDGGVHSHIEHVKALATFCKKKGIENLKVHAFTDGRDTDPKGGYAYLEELQDHLNQTGGEIASVIGRYYAMDRDKRWERVKLAYDALVKGEGEYTNDVLAAVKRSYDNNVTDEFIKPIIKTNSEGAPAGLIRDGDAVICFNFRTDRCREITVALTQTNMPELHMHKMDLYYTTMTEYDKTFQNVHVIFETDNLSNTLGETLEREGLQQIRIAETEKYPHVTFFFNGGREVPFTGESRILCPSPKVATYDLKPEMSAYDLTAALLPEIAKQQAGFICINFANADMVGHTGVFPAVVKAVETVDECVKQLVTAALENNYTVFLTADHGNADYMINPDGTPNTAHSMNPVPFFIIDKDWKGEIKPGKLGDLAPTILTVMGIQIPKEMTGNVLI
jgi:2,3-bisphosphoglycerate-independent phosphoglycerate mutase